MRSSGTSPRFGISNERWPEKRTPIKRSFVPTLPKPNKKDLFPLPPLNSLEAFAASVSRTLKDGGFLKITGSSICHKSGNNPELATFLQQAYHHPELRISLNLRFSHPEIGVQTFTNLRNDEKNAFPVVEILGRLLHQHKISELILSAGITEQAINDLATFLGQPVGTEQLLNHSIPNVTIKIKQNIK